MNIFKQYAPIYRNATVLLRPRTPLKDMYLSLDPGTKPAGAVPDGGMLGAGSTTPDVDLDQILASLDGDTRSYLLLLLQGGAGAFQDPAKSVPALRGTFKRFEPLDRDTPDVRHAAVEAQRQPQAPRSTTSRAWRPRSAASTDSSRR